jgi:hypothetical protein
VKLPVYGCGTRCETASLIDYFSLALTHGLIAVALWRMLFRPELDCEEGSGAQPRAPWRKKAAAEPEDAGDA